MTIETTNWSILLAFIFWFSIGCIFYTYFGYPILITFLAQFRPHILLYDTQPFFVTLLIAAYNEELVIEEKIKNCLAINYPRDHFQILVVSDGSSDHTPEIVGKYASQGVTLMHQPERRGKMAAINRAIPQARGDIVVFSDANNHYQPDTISKLVAPFCLSEVGAVSGSKVIIEGDGSLGTSEGLYWMYESFIKKQESRLGSCTSASGEILAIRKSAYISPPDRVINDDFFLAMQVIRQGYRMLYVPAAKSFERVSPTARDEITRRTRIIAGRYQAISMAGQVLPFKRPLLVWQIISHKFLRPLVPFFMIGAALANLLAVVFPAPSGEMITLGKPFSIIMLGLQAVFYLLAWTGSRVNFGDHKLAKILYLPTFFTNSNLAALKGFIQYLRGQQSPLWERIQRR
jgi:cellulose synthase/poly-beta-1,6-N-acetylglucosamine synthase-like glycosyltransferase